MTLGGEGEGGTRGSRVPGLLATPVIAIPASDRGHPAAAAAVGPSSCFSQHSGATQMPQLWAAALPRGSWKTFGGGVGGGGEGLLFEMAFSWGFHIIKTRAGAFQVAERPVASMWRYKTAQLAQGTALPGRPEWGLWAEEWQVAQLLMYLIRGC